MSSLPFESRTRRRIDAVALLHSHPVFGALAPAQIEHLVAMAHPRRVARDSTLFGKGDPGAELFAVVSGTVKITVPSSDGREALITLIQRGEIFGEIALLDGQPRTADAVAMTDGDLLIISADHGCDPTTEGTDHTREYAPVIMYGHKLLGGSLGTIDGFFSIATSVLKNMGIKPEFGRIE